MLICSMKLPKTQQFMSFAISVICTFVSVLSLQDDIGLGAVVGSAVFNIMFVISVCALFAGMVRIHFVEYRQVSNIRCTIVGN